MTSYDDKIVDGSSSSSSSSDWNSSSTDQQQQQRAFIVSMPAASPLGIPNVSTTLHAESDSVSNQGTTTTTSPLTRNSMNPSNGPQMFIASPMYNKLTAVFVEELKSGRNRCLRTCTLPSLCAQQQWLQELGAPKPASDFASGAMLGACISTVMYPLNTVKTHMQINLGTTFVGIYQTFLQVLRARGGEYKKLFRGVHLNCTRALMSWGIINMSYEYLKHILLDEDSR